MSLKANGESVSKTNKSKERIFMDVLLSVVQTINAYLSDYILLILLLGAGLYFSIRTRFVQVRCFGEGMKTVCGGIGSKKKDGKGSLSSFQALATAVAAPSRPKTSAPSTRVS